MLLFTCGKPEIASPVHKIFLHYGEDMNGVIDHVICGGCPNPKCSKSSKHTEANGKPTVNLKAVGVIDENTPNEFFFRSYYLHYVRREVGKKPGDRLRIVLTSGCCQEYSPEFMEKLAKLFPDVWWITPMERTRAEVRKSWLRRRNRDAVLREQWEQLITIGVLKKVLKKYA